MWYRTVASKVLIHRYKNPFYILILSKVLATGRSRYMYIIFSRCCLKPCWSDPRQALEDRPCSEIVFSMTLLWYTVLDIHLIDYVLNLHYIVVYKPLANVNFNRRILYFLSPSVLSYIVLYYLILSQWTLVQVIPATTLTCVRGLSIAVPIRLLTPVTASTTPPHKLVTSRVSHQQGWL